MKEAKNKVGSSHRKTTTPMGKVMVNFLKKEFQLLKMVRSLFHRRLDYSRVIDLKINYRWFSSSPQPHPTLWQ